ncbi:hypothetical protein [Kribbella sp. NPDC055071]
MSDIEKLLNLAADDDDRDQTVSAEMILRRGRTSVRRRRIIAAGTVVLAVVAGIALRPALSVFGSSRQTSAPQVAGPSPADPLDGVQALPAPPISPVKDAEILRRCRAGDAEALEFNRTYKANGFDKAGPLDARWTLAVKSGRGDAFMAIFVSPDRSIAATCSSAGLKGQMHGVGSVGRTSTTYVIDKGNPHKLTMSEGQGIQVPIDVRRVVLDVAGETRPREALMSKTGGFYVAGWPDDDDGKPPVTVTVRGFDGDNQLVFDEKSDYPAQQIGPTVK